MKIDLQLFRQLVGLPSNPTDGTFHDAPVTVTGINVGDFYQGTVTIGGTWAAGDIAGATINGVAYSYIVTANDVSTGGATATTLNNVAIGLANVINKAASVTLAVALAAVVNVVSTTAGAGGNYTLAATKTSAAGTTTASGLNLATAANPIIPVLVDPGLANSNAFYFPSYQADPGAASTLVIAGVQAGRVGTVLVSANQAVIALKAYTKPTATVAASLLISEKPLRAH